MKLGIYLQSFWKHYFSRKPKLILSIILTVVVFMMINGVVKDIMTGFRVVSVRDLLKLGGLNAGIYILFIKPIFVYISGLFIIKYI